ncbi:MAG: hypothetical protein ACM3MG_06845 [Bacillota bacterium]
MKAIALLFGSLLIFSEASAQLLVKMNSQSFANPTTTMSCRGWKEYREKDDVAPYFISLGTPSFIWSDKSHSFQIYAIKIFLRSPFLEGGQYECLVQGKDLQALGEGNWLSLPAAGERKSSSSSGDCELVCGGVRVHADKAVVLYGRSEVYGVSKDTIGKTEILVFAVPLAVDAHKSL